jgi:hypothetical protein
MFGFLLGTLCLFGLAGMARHHYAYGGYGRSYGGGSCGSYRGHHRSRHGYGGEGRSEQGSWVGDDRFARAAGEVFKRRLRIHEDQEAIIDHALKDLHAALKDLRSSVKDSRSELATAFKGEAVDDAQLAVLFDRWTDDLKKARQDVVSSLKQIHAVLDEDQRKRATDWLGQNPEWV